MKLNKFVLIIFSLYFLNQSQAQPWSQRMAATVMTIWKDSLSMNPGRPVRWAYDQGVVLKGVEGIWKNTADKKYFDYIQKSMDHFVQEDGTIRTYRPDEYNIDHVLNGRNLLFLYKTTLQLKYLKAVQSLRAQLRTHPRTAEGGFWHKKIYPYQMWLDGLYMGEPFYAEYAATFGEDSSFNDIGKQFILMEKNSRDSATGLLYHGYDESRLQKWADKNTGRSPHFWARALGWYGMGLVDALEWFPECHPKRDSLVEILNRFSNAVIKVQDKSGLWWDIVDLPGKDKNYLEASASSMITYALAKGVRLGYLSPRFLPFAEKAYDGIIKNFIKTENGQVNLHGTVSVSGLGGNPYRDGSFEYYMSEKAVVNDPKGVGAFLLASNEIEMAKTTRLGQGKTVLLDHYFNHETKRGPTGMVTQHHYVWYQQDLNGYSMLGHVFNKFGVETKAIREPLQNSLKDADIYLIVDPDTEKESANPNYILPHHADVIYDWVKQGGVLLLFGNDSGNVEFNHFNGLAKKFGIRFNGDSRNRLTGTDYIKGTFAVPAGHAIFKTSKQMYIKEYSSQTLTHPANAVFLDGKVVVMSVAKVGKGTVFAVGDPWFYNEYFDGRKLPADLENYKAGEDLVKWVIQQVPVN